MVHSKADTRERILDAAAEVFMRRGYATVSVDDLARCVGATKGLVYYHFRSKFDVFLAVYEEAMAHAHREVSPHAKAAGTGAERLEQMAIAHLTNLMERLGYHHVVHQGVRDQDSPALTVAQRDALTDLNNLRHEYEAMFVSVVEAGVVDGTLRPANARTAARVLLGGLNGVDAWYAPRPGEGPEQRADLAQEIADVLLGGLRA